MAAKRVLIFFLIIILLGTFSYFYPQIQNLTGQTTQDFSQRETAILVRVVDGDTIKVIIDGESEEESVRMLGINTPEKNMPMASEAKKFLQDLENKTIILESDSEDRDKYNRLLRYVFYGDTFLNKEILRKGLANAYMFSESKYKEELLKAEQEARENSRGIWERSHEKCAECIELEEFNDKQEYFILRNSCSFSCSLKGWFVKDSGRNTIYLQAIEAGKIKVINSTKEIWNSHDQFFLFDEAGKIVIYYEY